MAGRQRKRGKFSSLALIVDHFDTFRDASTGRVRLADHLIFFGLSLGPALLAWFRDARAGNIPEVLAAAAILTGLIFNVFVLLFDLTMRATDRTDPAHQPLINKLADELRANISYAVLLGLSLTAILGGFAMLSESKQLHPVVTALIVFIATQMLLTVSMILKRIRALYRAFRVTGAERIP